jgi:DNA polymerase-1
VPTVPSRTWYDPVLDAVLHTGDDVVEVLDIPAGSTVAMDIETPGLDRNFEINCVTVAWHGGDGKVHSALLDPLRNYSDATLLNAVRVRARGYIFHSAPFDVPALWHHGFFGPAEIDRVIDTLVLSKMAWPNPYDPVTGNHDLSSLSVRLLGMNEFAGGMDKAFKAAGFKNRTAGYEGMDIDSPIYRLGAMADTVATLRIEPLIRHACRRQLTDHPFDTLASTTDAEADEVIAQTETVNRVMLYRTAVGIAVDQEYLAKYAERVDIDRKRALAELNAAGLDGGSGKGPALVKYLHEIGELPDNWPTTGTGRLSSTKDLLDGLDHPLTRAQRFLAETDKVLNIYLDKVNRQSAVTGRCHPQVKVLGASQTGRMSYSSPELQQFSEDARPILIDDGQGLSSIDWSQIEPVMMGLLAKDAQFLAPYEAGQDLYEPIMEACSIDRKLAKVVLLATMYGQGTLALSGRIDKTEKQATLIRREMLRAMPESAKWMTKVSAIADQYGKVPTAGGRILPVDAGFRAVNYMIQGTAYDVLAHTITEMKRRGISEHLYLAMHDEVVVSTPVAAEVREIMQTPPPWLTRVAGRVPVLRTDREDMGGTWLKV